MTGTWDRDLARAELSDDETVYRVAQHGGFGGDIIELQRHGDEGRLLLRRVRYTGCPYGWQQDVASKPLARNCWVTVERAVAAAGFWTADVLVSRDAEAGRLGNITDIFTTKVEGRRGGTYKAFEFIPSFNENEQQPGDRLVATLFAIARGDEPACRGR